jgi:hypothetical protein
MQPVAPVTLTTSAAPGLPCATCEPQSRRSVYGKTDGQLRDAGVTGMTMEVADVLVIAALSTVGNAGEE